MPPTTATPSTSTRSAARARPRCNRRRRRSNSSTRSVVGRALAPAPRPAGANALPTTDRPRRAGRTIEIRLALWPPRVSLDVPGLERWLSGRKRWFAKPVKGFKSLPRVRIPLSPPSFGMPPEVMPLDTPILFVATTSAKRARAFYGDVLGLTFVSEDDFAIVFAVGALTLRIQKVPAKPAIGYTVLGWKVDHIQDEVRRL